MGIDQRELQDSFQTPIKLLCVFMCMKSFFIFWFNSELEREKPFVVVSLSFSFCQLIFFLLKGEPNESELYIKIQSGPITPSQKQKRAGLGVIFLPCWHLARQSNWCLVNFLLARPFSFFDHFFHLYILICEDFFICNWFDWCFILIQSDLNFSPCWHLARQTHCRLVAS
jgi:hypothetical protein